MTPPPVTPPPVTPPPVERFDVVVIGAGAAGLTAAIEAGRRGRRVLVLDHADKPGRKILISGGGRCNFTNLHAAPDRYLSNNRHFCTSALKRYTQHDFLARVDRHGIRWHERKHGQLFCDGSAADIVAMLLGEAEAAGVTIRLGVAVTDARQAGPDGETGFTVHTRPAGPVRADSLVVASGGLSVPKVGASDVALRLARRLGLAVVEPRPGLVPFTLPAADLARFQELAGLSLEVAARCDGASFREALLFTHRGLSGPAVLQASSYWVPGAAVTIDLLPDLDLATHLKSLKGTRPKAEVRTLLAELMPRRLAERMVDAPLAHRPIGQATDRDLTALAQRVKRWELHPAGTEGYRTAEVTVGGVDTAELSSKTMEARKVPGLYVVGEAVDVTGHLGGYNFQWAWSSGWSAGQHA